jgi:hypothetical protein
MTNLQQFKDTLERPLIGVIGATFPDKTYSPHMGEFLGAMLREYVEKNSGTIFTGGVEGVGLDVYKGIIQKTKELNSDQDKFFVLGPHFETTFDSTLNQLVETPYLPPKDYRDLSRSINKKLHLIRGGRNMRERREYLSILADKVFVVNGSFGTLDEAVKTLTLSKPVISLYYTGGAAKILRQIKERIFIDRFDLKLIRSLEFKMEDFVFLSYIKSEDELKRDFLLHKL